VRELGVGLVYWSELATLFEDADLVGVLELEPQTLWEKVGGPHGLAYRVNDELLRGVAQLPQAKLLHGIGQPVGGTVDDPLDYVRPLRQAVDLLDPEWVSEHLSFNRVRREGRVEEAGFLLPPRQSRAGASVAARNIARIAQALERPFAFETGVNYLRSRSDELDDGAFFGLVAAEAQCGILLDLHNLWCNERNGRQSVSDALAQVPLNRVWEVHLAGGMEFDGYWLDAHSDAVPLPVMELAAATIPRLPNLGAIMFEVLPQHLARIGIDGVRRQLEAIHDLWSLRPQRRAVIQPASAMRDPKASAACGKDEVEEIASWELALLRAVRGGGNSCGAFTGLRSDPGVRVLRQLIGDARRSSIARALRYTTILLLGGLGVGQTRALLDAYFNQEPPDPFAAIEADHFASYLRTRQEMLANIPNLEEVLAFEHALIRATLFGTSTELTWTIDPTALFDALDEGRPPAGLPSMHSTMRICSERAADGGADAF